MTSISPYLYAATQISLARQRMNDAATMSAQPAPRPGPGGEMPPVGPEVEAPESMQPHPRPEVEAPEAGVAPSPMLRAKLHATEGQKAITAALGVRTMLAPEVVTAIENAATQAAKGVSFIEAADKGMVDARSISKRFQSSALWLGLAGSLLAINHDTRWPVDPPKMPMGPGTPPEGTVLEPAV